MKCLVWILLLAFASSKINGAPQQENSDSEVDRPTPFVPTLTATCQVQTNKMVITLTTAEPFYGILISSNQRNNSRCYTEGTGQTQTTLTLNMIAPINDFDYCGVSINHKNNEKTAQISVRQNKVLELADDKNYLVSCSKFDSRPPDSSKPAHLALYDSNNREALEVVKTYPYKLKVKTTKEKNFRIRNCFAFSGVSARVPLVDQNGCPESKIISRWNFAENSAEATISSMVKFQESRQITFQCHILFCSQETCPNPSCSDTPAYNFLTNTKPDYLIGSNDTDSIISSTVTVLEPGEKLAPLTLATDDEVCTGRFCPKWLLWLAIILGVLFLLMLLVNLCMCSALTCTCTRTELVEKEPSIIEDYDPYNRSYFGDNVSHYNSRYSINNQKAYSDMSDHYATPGGQRTTNQEISRPNSRFSK